MKDKNDDESNKVEKPSSGEPLRKRKKKRKGYRERILFLRKLNAMCAKLHR